MAWYRQATNRYLITWTNVDDASWRYIASLGRNRLANRGSVTPCDDIGLGPNLVWRHQATTWTNVDLSVLSARSSDIHVGQFHKKIPQPQAIIYLSFCSTPWANGLNENESWIYKNKIMFLTDMDIQWNWPMVICAHCLTYPRPSRWLAHCLLINGPAIIIVSVNSLKPGAWKCISPLW